jgi:hypothetical protein
MPAITDARHTAQRRGAMAGDQDRRVQLLHRFGAEVRILKLVKTPLKGGGLLRPKRFANLQIFIRAAPALMKGHFQHVEFLFEPAHPHARRVLIGYKVLSMDSTSLGFDAWLIPATFHSDSGRQETP